jgi:hypothetical protein
VDEFNVPRLLLKLTNGSGLVDVTRHDTDLALSGLDDTGAVGTNQPGLGLAKESMLDLQDWVMGD